MRQIRLQCIYGIILCLFFIGIANAGIDDGLVAYYPFNANANDVSGNGHHGVVYGGATFVADRFGKTSSAVKFDGIDDYIAVINGLEAFSIGTSNFSMSIWVKVDQFYGGQGKVIELQGDSVYDWFLFDVGEVGYGHTAFFGAKCNTVNSSQTETFGELSVGQWTHFVGVRENASTIRFYINGGMVDEETNPLLTDIRNIPGALNFGRDPRGMYYLNGYVDDALFYNRALSDSEIQELYLQGQQFGVKIALKELIAEVIKLNLKQGIQNSLDVKLQNSLSALDDANQNNYFSASNKIAAFINEVEAKSGKEISTSDAERLIESANAIISMLNS
jgi:hypothetical protein